jgi:ADP-heptose:LPS heptosyltransferase/glycosyltransferase involved in cell wall biosynthesis
MKKIFIAQMTRMGDIVQTLPLIKRLKEVEEECQVTVMCIMEPMELIRRNPWVDRLIYLPLSYYKQIRGESEENSAKLQALFDNMEELRESYDLVVNLTHDTLSAEICRKIDSKRKSGCVFSRNGKVRTSGDWGKYLFAVVDNRAQNSFNLVDMAVGMGGIPHKPVENYFHIDDGQTRRTREILKSHGYKGSGRLVALQMGAALLHRAWPVKNFASFAKQLAQSHDIEFLLLGISKEQVLGQEFLRLTALPAINLIGETGINDLPAIISICDLLVSNDTGTAHIAGAVGTKVLGLYFSTAYYAETAPYGRDNIILQVELPCSPCLSPEGCESIECKDYLVAEAVEKAAVFMLDGGRAPCFDYPNLSVYQSSFSSNGTLVYEPLSQNVTEQFLTGFLNRMLWEPFLGLECDVNFVNRYLPILKDLDASKTKVQAYEEECESLRGKFHKALRLANDVYFELCRSPVDVDKTLSMNEELAVVQADIMASNNSLMRSFHHYELMDVEQTNYRHIARQIVGKYVRLHGMADSFLAILRELFVSPLIERHAGSLSENSGIPSFGRMPASGNASDSCVSIFDGMTGSSKNPNFGNPLHDAPESHSSDTPEMYSSGTPGQGPNFSNDEVLYLGLSSGPFFGWGICGDYLKKELSKLVNVISLGDRQELKCRKDLPGKVLHTLSALDFTSLFQARGTHDFGYTFFEYDLTKACMENAEHYCRIIAGSDWCKEKLLERGIRNAEVLIQGIDPDLFHPITEEKSSDSFVIFSGGKFELRKGQDLVLKAVKTLQEKYRDIFLVNLWFNQWPGTMDMMSLSPHIDFQLRGDTWEEKMRHLYAVNGLDAERIQTHSIVPHNQLRSLFQTTDVGVFPNRCEGGTNLVLMEYMACAKPVIATFATGHKDILNDRNALLLTNGRSYKMRYERMGLAGDWEEPSLDELMVKIEYAYHHRDEIGKIGLQAGKDLKALAWSRTAERLLEIVYG